MLITRTSILCRGWKEQEMGSRAIEAIMVPHKVSELHLIMAMASRWPAPFGGECAQSSCEGWSGFRDVFNMTCSCLWALNSPPSSSPWNSLLESPVLILLLVPGSCFLIFLSHVSLSWKVNKNRGVLLSLMSSQFLSIPSIWCVRAHTQTLFSLPLHFLYILTMIFSSYLGHLKLIAMKYKRPSKSNQE